MKACNFFWVTFYRWWWGRLAHAVFAWVLFCGWEPEVLGWISGSLLLRCCWASFFCLGSFSFFLFEGVVGRVFEVFFYLFGCSLARLFTGADEF